MDIPFYSLKEGLQKLEYMVQNREKSRDISLYGTWVKDCEKFADKLIEAGADKEDVVTVLDWETPQGYYCGIFVKMQGE